MSTYQKVIYVHSFYRYSHKVIVFPIFSLLTSSEEAVQCSKLDVWKQWKESQTVQ